MIKWTPDELIGGPPEKRLVSTKGVSFANMMFGYTFVNIYFFIRFI